MNNHIKDIIVKIILIIIIIFLIIFNIYLLKNKKDYNVVSGDIDLFEIDCVKDCSDDQPVVEIPIGDIKDNSDNVDNNSDDIYVDDAEKKISSVINDSVDNNIGKVIDEDVEKEPFVYDDDIKVIDSYHTWSSVNELKIFSTPNLKNVIAPESTGVYKFIIKNNTVYNVNYDISFIEENERNINMKYRLLRNNEYVSGSDSSWVSYSDLDLSDIYLVSVSKDIYSLEWKWFSGPDDTDIGISGGQYSLKIFIGANDEEGF